MRRERAVLTGVFVAGFLWQLYVVSAAFRVAPEFLRLFSSMGAELPLLTRSLFATYRYWIAIPIAFAALAAHALINEKLSSAYVGILAAACILAGFVMQAWLYEGCFLPLFALTRQVVNHGNRRSSTRARPSSG